MFQPTRDLTFPAVTGINVKDVTPRLGVSTTCSATARRRSRSAWASTRSASVTIGNPAGITNTVTRTWTDANSNFKPDCNLLNLQAQDLRASGGDFCGIVSSLNFGLPTSVTKFNEDTRFGWGNRAYNWEFSTSVQHQLAAARGGGRRLLPPLVRQLPGHPEPADDVGRLQPVQLHRAARSAAAGRRRLPGTGLYDLNPNKVGLIDNYTTFARDFGKQIEHWNGVDASVNARLEHGIMLQGGFSVGRTITDNCEVRANAGRQSEPALLPRGNEPDGADPGQAARAPTWCRRPTSTSRRRSRARRVRRSSANYIAPNALVQPSLGRPLSGGAPT